MDVNNNLSNENNGKIIPTEILFDESTKSSEKEVKVKLDYIAVKCKLIEVIKNKDPVIFAKFGLDTLNMNNLESSAYELAYFYILYCLKYGLPLPTINQAFFEDIMRVLGKFIDPKCQCKAKKVEEGSLLERLIKFYEKEYQHETHHK